MTHTIIVDRRMLVPKAVIPRSAIEARYKIELFNERMCSRCDNAPQRPNDLCTPCEGFLAKYRLYKDEDEYWSLPQGDMDGLTKVLERKGISFRVKDRRPVVPFVTSGIRFTGSLFGANYVDANGIPRPNQKKLLKSWMRYQNGILLARPRSGKTVMAIWTTCRLQQRTVIMADRFELLKQFYKGFMGDPVKGRPAMTNIPQRQERTGREIIRLALKAKDLKNLDEVDILLVNYQKLVRDPAKMAALVNGNYSFLVVDEVHGSGAEGYLRVVSGCSVRHRMSLTATDRRKDNRHKLIYRIQGQVVARSISTSLVPLIQIKQSEITPPRVYKQYHHAMAWLTSNPDLMREMVREIFKDLRAGHEVIIVPLVYKKHIDALVKMVNHQARVNNKKRGERWPENLAIQYYDGVPRDEVLETVDKPGPTVLFAMTQMIKQGIDFERPSMIYVYIPMSASQDRETGAPMLDQLGNRVATPFKKPQPVIKVWFLGFSWFRNTHIKLFWNEIWPNRYKGENVGKYRVPRETYDTVKLIAAKQPKTKAQAKGRAKTQFSFMGAA